MSYFSTNHDGLRESQARSALPWLRRDEEKTLGETEVFLSEKRVGTKPLLEPYMYKTQGNLTEALANWTHSNQSLQVGASFFQVL